MNEPPVPNQAIPRRRFPLGRMVLLAFGGLIVTGLGIFLFWRHQNASRAAEWLAELRAAGEPVTTADLENFYRLPDGREDCTATYLAAFAPLAEPVFKTDTAGVPIFELSDHRAPSPPNDWPEREAVEVVLKKYQASLDRLHAAARQGGATRYPTDFSQGLDMLMPEVQASRAAARLLLCESLVRAHQGDARGAAESLRALWRCGESLEYEPLMISQLVRWSIGRMAIDQLEDLLPAMQFADEDLRMLQAEFRQVDARATLGRAMRGERVVGLHAIENYLGDDYKPHPTAFKRLMAQKERAYYLVQMRQYVAAADSPRPRVFSEFKRFDDQLEAEITRSSANLNPGMRMTAWLRSSLWTSAGAIFQHAALATAADAALACELFHRQHARWPATLDELVPDFLPILPVDPFDGLPLRMARHDDELLLYSVGADLADDGGMDKDRRGRPDVVFRLRINEATGDE